MLRSGTVASLFLVLFARISGADCLTPAWQSRIAPLPVSGNVGETMAVGDFDNDGIADAVIVRSAFADNAMYHRGRGDGYFEAPVAIFSGPTIRHFVARDLNLDGNLDLLFVEDRARMVFVAGKGDGTFASPVLATGTMGEMFAVGDLTGDDVDDLAAFYYTAEGWGVVLSTGNATGTFTETKRIPLLAPPYAIAIGDLDGDGANDIVAGYADFTNLELLFGNDDGTFDPAVPKTNASFATRIRLVDLEDDGDLDILTVNYFDRLAVHRNRGGRIFDPVTIYPVLQPDEPVRRMIDVAAGDVTGDGVLDLLVTGGNALATLRGLPDAAFDTPYFERFPGSSVAAGAIGAATDLDGDGRLDAIIAQNNFDGLRALLNRCGDVTVVLTPTVLAGQNLTVQVTASSYTDLNAPPFDATGTVTILEGETVLVTGTLSNGEVSLTVPGLAPGAHKLFARYSGDDQHEPAESKRIVVRVTSSNPATTPPPPRRRAVGR